MIIIPMAGKSSRFYKAGFDVPKFMLNVYKNSDVFTEAVLSFKKFFTTDFFVFIHRSDDNSEVFINKKCLELKISKFKLFKINKDTRGQADTIAIFLKTLSKIKLEECIYIFNIDSFRLNFIKPNKQFLNTISGYLELFEGKGNHWSFAKIRGDLVVRTAEKIRISNYCSNGLYYFSSGCIFLKTFEKMEKKSNKELFVAPMYNYLILDGYKVKYKIIDKQQTVFCGTPDEYTKLQESYEKR